MQISARIGSPAILKDKSLKAQDKIMAICNAVGASTYIKSIEIIHLHKDKFKNDGIELCSLSQISFLIQYNNPA